MWRSHQPRFHPDLNHGLYRERVVVVLSAPIRSYHVLMSILTIGLIVEKILAAKKFSPINTIASNIYMALCNLWSGVMEWSHGVES